jgi:hypothetical protein
MPRSPDRAPPPRSPSGRAESRCEVRTFNRGLALWFDHDLARVGKRPFAVIRVGILRWLAPLTFLQTGRGLAPVTLYQEEKNNHEDCIVTSVSSHRSA